MKQIREATARKLIDRLAPRPEWGALRGFVGTTYELQPDFLETDFLPALLDLGTWDDRSWTTRIALEKQLAELEAATILMEAHRYRGRPRSLRLELLPVAAPGGRKQHAKAIVLLYQRAVRFLVASANLTEPGYRRNREVVAVLGSEIPPRAPAASLAAALDGFEMQFAEWLSESARGLLASAREALQPVTGTFGSSPNVEAAWSGAGQPLLETFLDQWPTGERAERLTIVSPFWSDDGGRVLRRFIERCQERGLGFAEVRLQTEAAPTSTGSHIPVLPPSFDRTDWRALGLRVCAQAVSPLVSPAEVGGMTDFGGSRNLHAKIAVVEGPRVALAYLGSANFTARGWGIAGGKAAANLEAGVILRLKPGDPALEELLPPLAGEPLWLNGTAGTHLAPPEQTADDPPWPAFLREAKLVPSLVNTGALELRLELTANAAAVDWSVLLPSPDGPALLMRATPDGGELVHVSLDEHTLERLLIEQELLVRWSACEAGRLVPINVAAAARFQLPIAPGAGVPSEADLLAYYQGRISWQALFPEPNSGRQVAGASQECAAGLDKSRIQTYQVREFVEALAGLRRDLQSCAVSTPAIRLALQGPVSPVALARSVLAAVEAHGRTAMAAAFQLVEILACLRAALAHEVPKPLAAEWQRALVETTNDIAALLQDLEARHPADLRGPAFRKYRHAVLPGVP